MLPGIEMLACSDLAVPTEIMRHVVKVESSFNPYAIGVVDGRLARQPRSLAEAVATVRMLEEKGYNFSVGLAQVNRYNLAKYGLSDYERAFETCPNLQAGSRILAECRQRADGDWGKAFSCYYSGNFVTGYQHGYVQKVMASIGKDANGVAHAIPIAGMRGGAPEHRPSRATMSADSLLARRTQSEPDSGRTMPAGQAVNAEAPQTTAPADPTLDVQTPVHPRAEVAAIQNRAPEAASNPVAVHLMGAPAANGHGMAGQPASPQAADATPPATRGKDHAFVF